MRIDGETVSVLGMIGLNNALRVLGVNNIDIDAPLTGFLLLFRNQDVPGVIGRVGTLLGKHKINIANFALGRVQDSDEAIGIVNVDQKVLARSPPRTPRHHRRAPGARHRNPLNSAACGEVQFSHSTFSDNTRMVHSQSAGVTNGTVARASRRVNRY